MMLCVKYNIIFFNVFLRIKLTFLIFHYYRI